MLSIEFQVMCSKVKVKPMILYTHHPFTFCLMVTYLGKLFKFSEKIIPALSAQHFTNYLLDNYKTW